MKTLLRALVAGLLLISVQSYGQKYLTKNGFIKFFSNGQIEKIEGDNHQVNSALDIATGDFIFKVLMQSFVFEKALMQEHFNENYVESDKYPNSIFKGKITNLKDINFTKNGTYNAVVEGDLTIHGVTKHIKEQGTLEVTDGKILGKSKFNIELADYNIKIPGAVINNIAKTIEITVDIALEKLNK